MPFIDISVPSAMTVDNFGKLRTRIPSSSIFVFDKLSFDRSVQWLRSARNSFVIGVLDTLSVSKHLKA